MTESGSIYGKKIDGSNTLVIDFSNVDINGNLNIKSGLAIDNSFGVSGEVLTSQGSTGLPIWSTLSSSATSATSAIAARQSYKHMINIGIDVDYVLGYLSSWDYCETNFEYPSGFVVSYPSNSQSATSSGGQQRGGFFQIPSAGVYSIYGICHFNLNLQGCSIILWYKRGSAAGVKLAENYKQNREVDHEQSISLNVNTLFDAQEDDLVYITIGHPNSNSTTRTVPQGGHTAGIYFQIHKI